MLEALLLLAVALQIGSGIGLIWRGWSLRRGRVAWLQAVAGLYIAGFLMLHVGAVLVGRHVLGLDTNVYFAAAGFHVAPFAWLFAP